MQDMSIEQQTFTPKDTAVKTFERRDRKQDHATGAKSRKRRYTPDRWYDSPKRVVLERNPILPDDLDKMTPAQLERHADALLAEASGPTTAEIQEAHSMNEDHSMEEYVIDEYVDDEIKPESLVELNDYTPLTHEEISEIEESVHRATHEDRTRTYGSLGLALDRRRFDGSKHVGLSYEGTRGDDENDRDDVLRGFKITDRP